MRPHLKDGGVLSVSFAPATIASLDVATEGDPLACEMLISRPPSAFTVTLEPEGPVQTVPLDRLALNLPTWSQKSFRL